MLQRHVSPVDIYLIIETTKQYVKSAQSLKLTIKTKERRCWRRSGVIIVNFEQISHISDISIGDFEQVNTDCNWTRIQNHLIRKWTLNHLATHSTKLTKWLSCVLSTYLHGAFQITSRNDSEILVSCTQKRVRDMTRTSKCCLGKTLSNNHDWTVLPKYNNYGR